MEQNGVTAREVMKPDPNIYNAFSKYNVENNDYLILEWKGWLDLFHLLRCFQAIRFKKT